MSDVLCRNVATQGAVGYGIAPGTVATCMMLPMIWFLGSLQLSFALYLLCSLLFIIFGWYVTARALPFFSDPDPSMIVIDEMTAFPLVFLGISIHWQTVLLGFILFRLLDIYKPFGIAYAESLPGASGVMCDDIAAAVVSNIFLHMLFMF